MFHQQLQVYLEAGIGTATGLSAISSFSLVSPNGQVQVFGVNNVGSVAKTASTTGSGQAIVLQDSVVTGAFYLLSTTNVGQLELLSVSNPSNYLNGLVMQSPNGTNWLVEVSSGAIATSVATNVAVTPEISLRWSDDGGHTWSNSYAVSAGALGQYKTRCMWRRLGRARDRVYEITCTDPIPWRIIDSYLTAVPGFQPQARLVDRIKQGA